VTKEDRLGCCFAPDGWSVVAKGLDTTRPDSTASAWQRITTGRPLGFRVTVRPSARRYRTCAAGWVSGAHRSRTSVSDRYIMVWSLLAAAQRGRTGSARQRIDWTGQSPRTRGSVAQKVPTQLSWARSSKPRGDVKVVASINLRTWQRAAPWHGRSPQGLVRVCGQAFRRACRRRKSRRANARLRR
jgi:hypothetical protein